MKQTDFVEDVEIHPTTASECSDLVSGQGIDSHPVEVVIVSDDIATADADMSNNNYKSFHEHRARAIEDTLMELGDCQEPVTVLRIYQKNFMRGRPLDLMNETTIMEGETTEIFVSRLNLFEDGMDEILNVTSETVDRSFPLEVTFTGENARDQGGPRREFLSSMLQQIKERLCTEGEDGNFNLCDNLWLERAVFTLEQALFLLIMRRPILIYLFRRTAVSPMTYPKIVKLMKPNFSEEGSNRRILEEQSYRHFLKYCKEVAAGRRGVMKLENILKFVSGSEYEPVLGFSISPQIDFVMSESSYPTANTCINKLCLVIGDKNVGGGAEKS
ncbi:uncharacterized protein LOC114524162 [Dendronephthya gigantea]|uniref:uncharacterized protein LOC114524162 n=1 Tax=Dendronephthya gigantea TaxID=151771 RepID=UPI001069ED59|nr:uncharacterized protein LOC114524162 [Dendronephthya gigantea]